MIAYLLRRIGLALLTVWIISILAFIIIQLPEGDAATKLIERMMGNDAESDYRPEMADELRRYLGLNEPMHVRYFLWIGNMATGDFGRSFNPGVYVDQGQIPVSEVIGDRLWTTVALAGFTIIVTWTMAIPIGIYSAVRQHSIGDYVITFIGFSGLAVPDFLLGLVLMYVAYAYFDQNVGGLFSANYVAAPWSIAKAKDLMAHLWVPAIVLGTSGTAGLIRVMRNNLLDELSKPYVSTARVKGVTYWKIVIKYPLRAAINPLISTVGYLLPTLVSGSVIVSVVLSLPTLGPVLLDAIFMQDVYLAGLIVLMLGILTIIGTLLSDILLAFVDPRIKLNG